MARNSLIYAIEREAESSQFGIGTACDSRGMVFSSGGRQKIRGATVKINYESNKLTISDVSIDLLTKIIQTIEEHEAGREREQKAEEWRALADEDSKLGGISCQTGNP